uniref:ATP synthase complex subunit 8 n=1 Tax=Hydromanicus wulaianus TaxID=1435189 RepID=A0A342CFH9_9NEOP|nr:ATP synthase F0 subunit 8 [Hydromanicus wulaianus]AHC32055.1 ATP synthase F0 subunit 8 [Hydromanicus wulaianus]
MPQMMPLNWLILMIFFSLIFLFTFLNLYYFYTPDPFTKPQSSILTSKINWKW